MSLRLSGLPNERLSQKKNKTKQKNKHTNQMDYRLPKVSLRRVCYFGLCGLLKYATFSNTLSTDLKQCIDCFK